MTDYPGTDDEFLRAHPIMQPRGIAEMFRNEVLGQWPAEPKSVQMPSIEDPGFQLIKRWVNSRTVPTVELGAALRDWADYVDPEHASSTVRRYSVDLGDGEARSFRVHHGLDSQDVIVHPTFQGELIIFGVSIDRISRDVIELRVQDDYPTPGKGELRIVVIA